MIYCLNYMHYVWAKNRSKLRNVMAKDQGKQDLVEKL